MANQGNNDIATRVAEKLAAFAAGLDEQERQVLAVVMAGGLENDDDVAGFDFMSGDLMAQGYTGFFEPKRIEASITSRYGDYFAKETLGSDP